MRTARRILALAALLTLAGANGASMDSAPNSAELAAADAALLKQLELRESDRPVRELIRGWQTPTRILLHSTTPDRLDFMQAVGPGVSIVAAKDKREALRKIGDVDAVIGSYDWCTADLVAAGKKLRWIHINAAGANECAFDAIRERQIVLTNQQGVFAPEISDHVMALLLALTRGLDGTLKLQREGRWDRETVPASRLWGLEGRTLLVAGLGGIGTEVARRAHGMGMRVIATRASRREGPDFVEYVGLSDELPQLIGRADVVVNALPLTPATQGLFNAEMFARMQKHAYFISVGRGPTTVTGDLNAALNAGVIGGAGLDVTEPEPLPAGHPLWSAPNIIITPHVSSVGEGAGPRGERAWRVMREQLRRFVSGEKLYGVVDLGRGY